MQRNNRLWLLGGGVVLAAAAFLILFLFPKPQPALSLVTVTPEPIRPITASATLAPATPPTVDQGTDSPPTTTPSATPRPATATPVPVIVVTSSPTSPVFATLDLTVATPATAVPTPVPPFSQPQDVVNILLLGNDVDWAQGGRTDSMIIVSLNKETGTVNLLSLPRDLYVYIPGWKMERLNLAYPHGNADGSGGGSQLIKETLLYNFGISVDYTIRIGFEGFKQAVDLLGGIEIVVNCPLTDWRLMSPELDPEVEENWAQFTLETGIQTMDGDMALWYVRSRRTTNDFERGRRQQQVIRAILQAGVNSPRLLTRIPTLWDAYQTYIETDMPLTVMVELAALAPSIDGSQIRSLTLYGTTRAWQIPVSREMVQLPQWETAQPIFAQLMTEPGLGQGSRPPLSIEVVAPDSIYYRQVAENLSWYGIASTFTRLSTAMPDQTEVTYYGTNLKGSYDWLVAWLFYRQKGEIELAPQPEASTQNYHVVIGKDYSICQSPLFAPTGDEP